MAFGVVFGAVGVGYRCIGGGVSGTGGTDRGVEYGWKLSGN